MNNRCLPIATSLIFMLLASSATNPAYAASTPLRRAARTVASAAGLFTASTAATAGIFCLLPDDFQVAHDQFPCVSKKISGCGKFVHMSRCYHSFKGLLHCKACRESTTYRELFEILKSSPTLQPPAVDHR